MRKNKKRKLSPFLVFFLILLFLSNICLWQHIFDLTKGELAVVFFDVGQGDAIFIETPAHYQILIDGGPDETILEHLSQEIPFWDRTIDLIVLTHPDKDHLAGLITVLESYRVKNILWTGVIRETDIFQIWLEKIAQEGTRIVIGTAGGRIKQDSVVLEIVSPLENLEGVVMEEYNDSSLVTRLVFGDTSFLFTGDITDSTEKDIISEYEQEDIESDVLKVAHHGSKSSSAQEFLELIDPEIAVISCGLDNPYNHPHPAVLEKLEKSAIKVLRTDIEGNVKISSDGTRLIINTSSK